MIVKFIKDIKLSIRKFPISLCKSLSFSSILVANTDFNYTKKILIYIDLVLQSKYIFLTSDMNSLYLGNPFMSSLAFRVVWKWKNLNSLLNP